MQHESLRRPASKFHRTYTFPKHRLNIPTTIPCESPGPPSVDTSMSDEFHTPQCGTSTPGSAPAINGETEVFFTPQGNFLTPKKYSSTNVIYNNQKSNQSNTSNDRDEVFKTPDECFSTNTDIFDKNFNALQKSASSSVVERIKSDLPVQSRLSLNKNNGIHKPSDIEPEITIRHKTSHFERRAPHSYNNNYTLKAPIEGVLRSKSDFIIPKLSPEPARSERTFSNIIAAFLTPRLPRRAQSSSIKGTDPNSVPSFSDPLSKQDARAVSMGNLKLGNENGQLAVHGSICSR